ncbi:4Fe-4S dicluster domain-containing protein [Desulfurobacterium thermolithotrophum]|uniref:4Fe-4S dicluster domain-containing protein n=1 Tax=Desulfurobacterium thermolithotrophum TaxID=64160 RepID=UPI001953EC4A|nr:hypothetical protein [Desulfurobacterium thermolithotrophum]
MENVEVKEDELLSDENGNYAYLTLGGYLYTPAFLETIDKEKCQNCEQCLQMCETRDLDEEGNIIAAYSELCSGCGHCVNLCPSKGIKATPLPLQEMIKRMRRRKEENR